MIYIKLQKHLLIYETLSGDEIRDLILKDIKPTRSFKEEENDDRKIFISTWITWIKAKTCNLKIMIKYYTRACNFYYGKQANLLIKKKRLFLYVEIKILHLIILKFFQEKKKN